jgi:hypothetical protein
MLAYLDDLLDADDEEQLAAKIRESDFASGLVHRIRGTVGRTRLSSPQVLGKGLAADANTVAEYLDNTLSAERVPDFEKICLESDLHLAEVASCHQILTLVLGEPAAMGPHLRQRVYDLPGRGGSGSLAHEEPGLTGRGGNLHPASHATERTAAGETPHKRTHRSDDKHARGATAVGTRPDYMAAPAQNRLRWIVATLGVLMVVAFGAWYFRAVTGKGIELAENPQTRPMDPRTENLGVPAVNAGEGFEAFMPPATESTEGNREPPLGIESHGPHTLPPDATDNAPLIVESSVGSSPQETSLNRGPSNVTVEPTGPETTTSSLPDLPLETATTETTSLASTANMAANSSPSVIVPAPTAQTGDQPAAPVLGDIPSSQSTVPSVLYSDVSILAHFDAAQGGWTRTPSQVPLPSGLRLRAASTFRPRMRLGANLDLQWVGGTEFIVNPSPSASITLTEGQVVIGNLATTPETSESLSLDTRTGHFVVTLPTVGTFVAFEAIPAAVPGTDPRGSDTGLRCRLWVAGGSAMIGLPNGDQTTFPEGTVITVQPDGVTGVEQSPAPAWSFTQDLRDIDRQAQGELLGLLDPNVPLMESLLAVARGRRTDVQSVAARVLASLGEFQPIVQFLDDPKHHPSWRMFFGELQRAVRHHADSAALVEAALKAQYPADAELMFRLLWGYSDSQLTNGEAKRLVGLLDDSRRMVRVLAFENLVQITGKPGTYRPNMPPSRMRDAIRGWQKKLEGGEIGGMPIEVPSEAVAQPR